MRSWAIAFFLLAAPAFGSACGVDGPLAPGNAANPQLKEKVFPVSCDDGRRFAARTLKARNFQITDVERTPSGGTVSGVNKSERFTAKITVECLADGVRMKPSAGNAWVEQGLRFGFHQMIDFEGKTFPPPTYPVVKLDLISGPEGKLEFPESLESSGLVAVRVDVLNAGQRVLRIDPRQVHAVSASGGKTPPVPATEVERRLASDPDLKSKLLRNVKLKPGEKAVGFVFFPAAAYQGAGLALIDDKTNEADDFDVMFAGQPS